MKKSLYIKNALIPDYSQRTWTRSDILVRGGVIESISDKSVSAESNVAVEDLKGKTLIPSFVDLRTHINLPPFIRNGDFNSLASAAFAGGYSTVLACPLAPIPVSSAEQVRIIKELSRRYDLEVLPVVSLSDNDGRPSDIVGAITEGAMAVCAENENDPYLIEEAMKIASEKNVLFICHASDSNPLPKESGYDAYRKGIISSLSEDLSTAQVISLAERTGCRLHITGVSSAFSVSQIRRANKGGLNITCDTYPQYFSLTASDVIFYGNSVKLSHPLRKRSDLIAIKEGIADGTIDAIATDHTPIADNEKKRPFDEAPVGMLGLQTAFSIGLSELVKPGTIDLIRLSELMSLNPAGILGRKIDIKVGSPFSMTVCDIDSDYILNEDMLGEKHNVRNTPWLGQNLSGRIVKTY